ncbi:MAG: hypothetical protein H6717_33405 [Polyangiaceae bacterium]|nr:hypothetical protein [Polyangiaceae bacterium]
MLDGVDAIAWGEIQDAYGAATKVPSLLRAVSKGDEKALADLTDRIAHQGLSTPAAVPAAPFLLELAQAKPTDELLVLLTDLACGGSHVNVPLGKTPREELPSELVSFRDALVEHWTLFRDALSDKNADLRAAAALGLGFLPEKAEEATAALRARIPKEKSGVVLSTALLALSELGDASAEAEPFAKHRAKDVQLAVLIARAKGQPADAELQLELIAKVAPDVQKPGGKCPFNEGRLAQYGLAVALDALGRAGASAALSKAMKLVGWMPLVPHILKAALPKTKTLPYARSELPEGAAELLMPLAEEVAKAQSYNPYTLESWGLLSLPRLLGLTPPRTLDEEIDGEPVWRTALLVNCGRKPESAWTELLEQLPLEKRRDLADDLMNRKVSYHLRRDWFRPFAKGLDLGIAHHTAFLERVRQVLATLPAEEIDALARERDHDALFDVWTERCEVDPARDLAIAETLDNTHIDPPRAQRIVNRLPPPRREAVVLAMRPNFLVSDASDGRQRPFLRGSLAVAPCAPTPAVRDHVVQFFANDAYLTFDAPAAVDADIVRVVSGLLSCFGEGTRSALEGAIATMPEKRVRWRGILEQVAGSLGS